LDELLSLFTGAEERGGMFLSVGRCCDGLPIRPPVTRLDFEVDVRRVSEERVVA
jgi:hypothetical protein